MVDQRRLQKIRIYPFFMGGLPKYPIGLRKTLRNLGLPFPWSWACLSLLFSLIGSSVIAIVWLTRVPPITDCRLVNSLSSDQEQMYCAEVVIRSGDIKSLINGLRLVGGWTSDHPLYQKSQIKLKNWSVALYAIAQQQWLEEGVTAAVDLANQIPMASPLYLQAQRQIVQWQQDWKYGETLFGKTQIALKTKQWQQANYYIQLLSRMNTLPWRNQGLIILPAQLKLEQSAVKQLQTAQWISRTNVPDDLSQAIHIVDGVDLNRYAYEEAQTLRSRWSAQLLTIAQKRFEGLDFSGTITAADKVPNTTKEWESAQDFKNWAMARLSARDLGQPLAHRIWGLMEAKGFVHTITPDRPVYGMVQTDVQGWNEQLSDLTQLQVAQTMAELGHPSAIIWAIEKAKVISTNRPEHSRSRSLIGQWQGKLQRLRDLPLLWRARELAQTNTISTLQEAIATAQKIPRGHQLRVDAQTWIAHWHRQTQILEGQPTLDKASYHAERGNYHTAIGIVQSFIPSHPLYTMAQTKMTQWRVALTLIEKQRDRVDQDLLNRAEELAMEERFTTAIHHASQITPGRPLYDKAQSAIRQWVEEREQFWQNHSSPPEE